MILMFVLIEYKSIPNNDIKKFWVLVCAFLVYVILVLWGLDFTRYHSTFSDPEVTVVNDKFSCIRPFYGFHLAWTWLAFLSGSVAIVVQIVIHVNRDMRSATTWLHRCAGRVYLFSILWATATSSVIRNEGLPLATLISFAWVLGGLTFGYFAIQLHSGHTHYIKYLHAALMITSWVGIAGRIFNYNTSKHFECYTHPVYKSWSNLSMELLPTRDAYYDLYPWAYKEIWGWGIPLVFVPFCGVLFACMIFHVCFSNL